MRPTYSTQKTKTSSKIYEVVPLLQRIADIERERKENNDPGQDEEEETDLIRRIKAEDNKPPKLKQLQDLNKEHADRVLTDIQNGGVTKVKGEQIQQKKVANNELKEIIQKLGALNNALEQTHDEATRNRTLEARKEFQSKYQNHFRKEAEKTTMFRQMKNLQNGSSISPVTRNKWTLHRINLKKTRRNTQTLTTYLMMYMDSMKTYSRKGDENQGSPFRNF